MRRLFVASALLLLSATNRGATGQHEGCHRASSRQVGAGFGYYPYYGGGASQYGYGGQPGGVNLFDTVTKNTAAVFNDVNKQITQTFNAVARPIGFGFVPGVGGMPGYGGTYGGGYGHHDSRPGGHPMGFVPPGNGGHNYPHGGHYGPGSGFHGHGHRPWGNGFGWDHGNQEGWQNPDLGPGPGAPPPPPVVPPQPAAPAKPVVPVNIPPVAPAPPAPAVPSSPPSAPAPPPTPPAPPAPTGDNSWSLDNLSPAAVPSNPPVAPPAPPAPPAPTGDNSWSLDNLSPAAVPSNPSPPAPDSNSWTPDNTPTVPAPPPPPPPPPPSNPPPVPAAPKAGTPEDEDDKAIYDIDIRADFDKVPKVSRRKRQFFPNLFNQIGGLVGTAVNSAGNLAQGGFNPGQAAGGFPNFFQGFQQQPQQPQQQRPQPAQPAPAPQAPPVQPAPPKAQNPSSNPELNLQTLGQDGTVWTYESIGVKPPARVRRDTDAIYFPPDDEDHFTNYHKPPVTQKPVHPVAPASGSQAGAQSQSQNVANGFQQSSGSQTQTQTVQNQHGQFNQNAAGSTSGNVAVDGSSGQLSAANTQQQSFQTAHGSGSQNQANSQSANFDNHGNLQLSNSNANTMSIREKDKIKEQANAGSSSVVQNQFGQSSSNAQTNSETFLENGIHGNKNTASSQSLQTNKDGSVSGSNSNTMSGTFTGPGGLTGSSSSSQSSSFNKGTGGAGTGAHANSWSGASSNTASSGVSSASSSASSSAMGPLAFSLSGAFSLPQFPLHAAFPKFFGVRMGEDDEDTPKEDNHEGAEKE